ncbi:MAG: nucleotidyltransferase domain-containing protein [Armatimonadetes bacterium]|nr:nucleotidyltransferase domain-containing protein [Armatimonadota bacterium]
MENINKADPGDFSEEPTIIRTTTDISPTLWKQYRPFRSTVDILPTPELVEKARAVANAVANHLKARFGGKKVVLFGSLSRGDFHKWSDIDLAVWGVSCADYYRAVAFASGFSDRFKVDLVDADDCSESLRRHILREGVEL